MSSKSLTTIIFPALFLMAMVAGYFLFRTADQSRDQPPEPIEKAIRDENPGIDEQAFGRERRARTGAKAEDWIAATVVELKELLAGSIAS